jgi:hypothetical protein
MLGLSRTIRWTEAGDRPLPDGKITCPRSVIVFVELNRSAYEPLGVGSLSQDRVLDGASCSMANNSPDGGESMQGLAEMIQTAIGN